MKLSDMDKSELLKQLSRLNTWVEVGNSADYPAIYAKTHSLMKPNPRQEIINNVYKSMQLIRIDFEYETVRKFVNRYLDKIGFEQDCNEINPYYIKFKEDICRE